MESHSDKMTTGPSVASALNQTTNNPIISNQTFPYQIPGIANDTNNLVHDKRNIALSPTPLVQSSQPQTLPSTTFQSSNKNTFNNNNSVIGESMIGKHLPFVSSNIDQFMQKSREQKISSSSNENEPFEYEPYTRRDQNKNDSSSGYITSPNETDRFESQQIPSKHVQAQSRVLSPDSSDYEKFEYRTHVIKNRDVYSASPADSQSGRSTSSHHRKSVSFDLDVDEYRPGQGASEQSDDNYDSTRLTAEKRIKGILRSPSPNVGTLDKGGTLTKRYVDDDSYNESETDHENPFRKEYLSQEELNMTDDQSASVTTQSYESDLKFVPTGSPTRRSYDSLTNRSRIPIKKSVFTAPILAESPRNTPPPLPLIPPPLPPKPVKAKPIEVSITDELERSEFIEFVQNEKICKIQDSMEFTPDDPLPPLPKNPPPALPTYKRLGSFERPKECPPPPPTQSPKILEASEEYSRVELLPATYEILPCKQKPRFVHENSTDNILVPEDVHREILLKENELRKAIFSTEYDILSLNNQDVLLTYLDDSSSIISSSVQSISPIPTLERESSQTTIVLAAQQAETILPPTQVLPVHYTQLPKPQNPGYMQVIPSHIPIALCTSTKGQSGYMVSADAQNYNNNNNYLVTSTVSNPVQQYPLIIVGQTQEIAGQPRDKELAGPSFPYYFQNTNPPILVGQSPYFVGSPYNISGQQPQSAFEKFSDSSKSSEKIDDNFSTNNPKEAFLKSSVQTQVAPLTTSERPKALQLDQTETSSLLSAQSPSPEPKTRVIKADVHFENSIASSRNLPQTSPGQLETSFDFYETAYENNSFTERLNVSNKTSKVFEENLISDFSTQFTKESHQIFSEKEKFVELSNETEITNSQQHKSSLQKQTDSNNNVLESSDNSERLKKAFKLYDQSKEIYETTQELHRQESVEKSPENSKKFVSELTVMIEPSTFTTESENFMEIQKIDGQQLNSPDQHETYTQQQMHYRIIRKAPPPPSLQTKTSDSDKLIYANIHNINTGKNQRDSFYRQQFHQRQEFFEKKRKSKSLSSLSQSLPSTSSTATTASNSVETFGEISPIRINNPVNNKFVYSPTNDNNQATSPTVQAPNDQNYSMTSFGKKETSV